MPQTKTARSNSKRTSKRTSPNGKRTTSNGSRAKSSARKTSSPSASKRSGSTAKKRSTSNGSKRAQPSTVAKAVEKAKGPAIAGGAALVGLAGGLALKNGKKRNGLGSMPRPKINLSMPKPKGSTVKILGGAAKEIAKGGYKIGQLTSEVQKVRQAVEGQSSDK